MARYNPLNEPDPAESLALDESERLRLIQHYHRRARMRLPNVRVHAAMHAIVENRMARRSRAAHSAAADGGSS